MQPDDQFSEFSEIEERLHASRPQLSDPELDRLRSRALSQAGGPSTQEKGFSMGSLSGSGKAFLLRYRLVIVAAGLVLLIAGTWGAVRSTGGGTAGTLNAAAVVYNSSCSTTGGGQGSYCAGNNLTACSTQCHGNNNTVCSSYCYGNNNKACTTHCEGNNNPQCTSYCYGTNNAMCTGTQPAENCYRHQHPSEPGFIPYPPTCSGTQTPPSCYTKVS